MKQGKDGAATRGGLRTAACALAGLALGACSAGDKIVRLPPPRGLPRLTELEKHLDYRDPDDGRPDYRPRRGTR